MSCTCMHMIAYYVHVNRGLHIHSCILAYTCSLLFQVIALCSAYMYIYMYVYILLCTMHVCLYCGNISRLTPVITLSVFSVVWSCRLRYQGYWWILWWLPWRRHGSGWPRCSTSLKVNSDRDSTLKHRYKWCTCTCVFKKCNLRVHVHTLSVMLKFMHMHCNLFKCDFYLCELCEL